MSVRFRICLAFVMLFGFGRMVLAESVQALSIRNGQFEPSEFTVPAGTRVKVVIKNQDATPAEFESYDLSREVIVPAHGEVSVFVGPLEKGRYEFFNDFNRNMKGAVIVNPAPGKN